MSRINRAFFFEQVRSTLYGSSLRKSQVDGMDAILDEWEAHHAKRDDRWLAYMLGTSHHETDRKMQPIREYGRGKGRPYGPVYYGRGFVQLTWDYNYKRMSKVVGRDLVSQPDLALDLEIAIQILFYGMIHGSFTGKRLSDYFNPEQADWVNARRIINGTDRANLVADYAKRYYAAISYTT